MALVVIVSSCTLFYLPHCMVMFKCVASSRDTHRHANTRLRHRCYRPTSFSVRFGSYSHPMVCTFSICPCTTAHPSIRLFSRNSLETYTNCFFLDLFSFYTIFFNSFFVFYPCKFLLKFGFGGSKNYFGFSFSPVFDYLFDTVTQFSKFEIIYEEVQLSSNSDQDL